ncbi:hypothetical protein INR49_028709 [Caranx melampygus]|nr:hypothetical protein INR49_028709 [Caranx melampygus]
MMLKHIVCILLVCFCALRVGASSSTRVKAPRPPGCYSMLAFSTEVSSLSEKNGSAQNIQKRSLSPWTWRSSTVKNRIPSTIWEAECSSSFCSSLYPGHTDQHGLNSVPIHQNILVLNQQEGGGCFTASYQSVAVGCTCVKAKTGQN